MIIKYHLLFKSKYLKYLLNHLFVLFNKLHIIVSNGFINRNCEKALHLLFKLCEVTRNPLIVYYFSTLYSELFTIYLQRTVQYFIMIHN